MSNYTDTSNDVAEQIEIAQDRMLLPFADYHRYIGMKYASNYVVLQFARNLTYERAWEIVLNADVKSFYRER